MRMLGFAQHRGRDESVAWLWRGRRAERQAPVRPRIDNGFGPLARLLPPLSEGTHG
jgi:hypothetical protein